MFLTSSGDPLDLSIAGMLTGATQPGQYDVFGYYLANSSGDPTSSLTPIFDTLTDTTGATSTLDLASGQDYGFYIESVQGTGTANQTDYVFYMDSADNASVDNGTPDGAPDSLQHFAAFQTSDGYLLGTVDKFACASADAACEPASEFDYNDLIVDISPGTPAPAPIPEPASGGLLASGLLVLLVFCRGTLRKTA